MNQYTVDEYGTKEWRNDNGVLHRLDGPARIWTNGSKFWYVNGDRHRIDGPAREWADGSKEWWVKGIRHRIDGPAITYGDMSKCWYLNGTRHRVDGPAIEWADGTLEWWINDCEITNDVNEWVKEHNITYPFDEPTQMMFLMKFG